MPKQHFKILLQLLADITNLLLFPHRFIKLIHVQLCKHKMLTRYSLLLCWASATYLCTELLYWAKISGLKFYKNSQNRSVVHRAIIYFYYSVKHKYPHSGKNEILIKYTCGIHCRAILEIILEIIGVLAGLYLCYNKPVVGLYCTAQVVSF